MAKNVNLLNHSDDKHLNIHFALEIIVSPMQFHCDFHLNGYAHKHLVELGQSQSNWFILICAIIALFLVVNLVKTLFKAAIFVIIISTVLIVILDFTPEELTETANQSLKVSSDFIQEKMVPIISDFYLGNLFDVKDDENNNRMMQLPSDD